MSENASNKSDSESIYQSMGSSDSKKQYKLYPDRLKHQVVEYVIVWRRRQASTESRKQPTGSKSPSPRSASGPELSTRSSRREAESPSTPKWRRRSAGGSGRSSKRGRYSRRRSSGRRLRGSRVRMTSRRAKDGWRSSSREGPNYFQPTP